MNANTKVYHGGSSPQRAFCTSGGGTPTTGDGPVILHTNYQYNDAEVTGMNQRFIAWKVICKHTFLCDGMGAFIHNTYGARLFELGLYDEAGAIIARIGQKVLTSGLHQEVQYNLLINRGLTKGNQYWLGIWGNGFDLATEIGFGNLGGSFPSQIHCIDESSESSLPLNISTFNSGTQQAAIWARGFYALI